MERSGAPWRERAEERRRLFAAVPDAPPRGRRPDGFPELDRGQVYAFPTGSVFHPTDCRAVMDAWDRDRSGLRVVRGSDVDGGALGRRVCGTCREVAV
jgi:hypothetical protein